ncbi:MAG: branched-chain amino acid ABC transporter permease [Clostridiales bacterium]|jgi:branched-chain amino acid transport system permease protein|nr:branched-chain amino acid ABC transporter permease [Clostridiales bacterium]
MKRLSRTAKTDIFTYSLVTVGFIAAQLTQGAGLMSSSLKGQLVPICAYIVMAVSLNLTVGILGELSLGHAGFMSIGAFAGAVAAAVLEPIIPVPEIRLAAAMIIGAVFAGIAGILIGVPVLRLKGDYLAIVTLAFGEIVLNLINCLYVGVDSKGLRISMLTSAEALRLNPDGRVIINGPVGASGITKLSSFTAGFLLILITLFIVQNLVNSRAGRAILAVRDNRISAESVGISVTKHKMIAFVISAVLAGAAGVLFALNINTIVPTKFNFNTSILVLVFVVLGGLGNIWGSIIAAAVLTVLPEALRGFNNYRMLAYAIVLILVMLLTNSAFIKSTLGRPRLKRGAKT